MRKGSKGVKNKHLRLINGKFLMQYTIEQAIRSKLFTNIVVSSDSKKIIGISKKLGIITTFLRAKKLSNDKAGKLDVIKNALNLSEEYFNKKFDIIFDLDVTSPLRKVSDIKNAYKLFLSENYKILISGCLAKKSPYFNQVEINKKDVRLVKNIKKNIVRRQDSPKVYDMNASIYIWRRDSLLNSDTLFTNNTGLYIMPENRSIDIDNEIDLKIVEHLLKKNN
jgi:CMP-N,N'-diacetyllegionaminic acid synthase